jgi:hypothetical protein
MPDSACWMQRIGQTIQCSEKALCSTILPYYSYGAERTLSKARVARKSPELTYRKSGKTSSNTKHFSCHRANRKPMVSLLILEVIG